MAIPHNSGMNSDNPFESNSFNQNPFDQPYYSQYAGTRQNPIDYNASMQAQAPQPVNNDPYANVSATEWFNADGEAFLSDSFGDMDGKMEWRIIRNDAIIRKVQNTTETLEGFEPER